MAPQQERTNRKPNILVTGTPGTGKTTFSDLLATKLEFEHVNASEWVKDKKLHQGYDESFDTYILDEDKVLVPKRSLG